MKPVNFENGELLSKKGKPVEVGPDEQLVVISGEELRTAVVGLEAASRHDRNAAERPSMPHSTYKALIKHANKFEELAEGFGKVRNYFQSK